jgi:RNA polymerase sigma-70 factor, ECF subfamily
MDIRRQEPGNGEHGGSANGQEPDLVGRLFEAHADALFRYCLLELGNSSDAEDAVSETFARVIRNPPRQNRKLTGDPDRAWLFGIARNVVREQRRYRRRHPAHPIDALPEPEDRTLPEPTEQLIAQHDLEEIRGALEDLRDEHRQVLLLRFVGGMSSDEVGESLGKSAGAVRIQQMRALEALRQQLAARQLDEDQG